MKIPNKVVITVIGITLLALAQLRVLDDAGLTHTEKGLSRALVTYGISRGLNGVISVVQGTEIAIEPVGVGMTFTPGQILDPINDLIERFSTVVLISGTAFGIQRVFLDIVATPAFSILIGLAVLLALLFLWFGKGVSEGLKLAIYRSAIIFLIIRFSVPLFAIGGERFYQYFLAPQYQESSEQLLSTTEQLNDLQDETEDSTEGSEKSGTKEKGIFENFGDMVRSATSTIDVRQQLKDFKLAAENISEHAIKLIVIFICQTIILPLGSIWLILKAIKWVALRKPDRTPPST
jgi:hypothetical protein